MDLLLRFLSQICPLEDSEESEGDEQLLTISNDSMKPYYGKVTKYDKKQAPEGYLNNLYEFLQNNINDNSEEIQFTIFEPNYAERLVTCPYFYFLNDDQDIMIKDFKNKYSLKSNDSDADVDSDSDSESEDLLNHIKIITQSLCDSNTLYSESKKGVFIFLSSFANDFHLLVDDIGIKFRLEVINSGKTFDSRDFIEH